MEHKLPRKKSAVSRFTRLVAGVSQRKRGFDSTSVLVRFVVGNVALGQVLS